MKTANEVLRIILGDSSGTSWQILTLKDWAKSIVQEAIDKVRAQPTTNPEEGEEDYRPGKYMIIGLLHEFKDREIL